MRRHPRRRTVQATGFVAELHIIPVFTVFATLHTLGERLDVLVVVSKSLLARRRRPHQSCAGRDRNLRRREVRGASVRWMSEDAPQ